MLVPLNRRDALLINFQPVANIAVPVSWFKEKGFEFHREIDDLDWFEFAPFWLNGKPIALMRHVSSPGQDVMLLVEETKGDEISVAAHASAAAEAFGLAPSLFSWRENGERVSFPRSGSASAAA